SFSLAAKRLSADTVDFTASGSSLSKGESFIDTALTIQAMGVSMMVVRHSSPGAPQLLARHLSASVLNAGDGTHEHPTQGLLDIFTIREQRGTIEGLTVALVGDILHSRVARSNIWGLQKLGARVIVCGPATLIPPQIRELGVEVSHFLDEIVDEVDCLNLLRVQFERQRGAFFPSISEYAHLYGMNRERLRRAKQDVLILAPGPINRGVEITPDVADGGHSVILNQVTNGLVIRMACLHLLHLVRTGGGESHR
ncbi:MAG: aspartate carbamoyltransferase catalytic subunit, partial [Planctomycetota bacterium]